MPDQLERDGPLGRRGKEVDFDRSRGSSFCREATNKVWRSAMTDVEIERVEIAAPRGSIEALEAFYGQRLGVPTAVHGDSQLELHIGHSTVQFSQTTGEGHPFYHFAFLVPGNRFEPAYSWLAARAEILPQLDSENTVFDFASLNAHACYFHDPADNIVELIAHRGLAESAAPSETFSADELIGVSEIGLVTPNRARAAEALDDALGLTIWLGEPHSPDGLAFLGRRAHTLILAAPGRGWLPTGRPAEVHPVRVALTGAQTGHVDLTDAPHQIRGEAAWRDLQPHPPQGSPPRHSPCRDLRRFATR
ncbi:hypothetical protein [Saccharopolyspora sp. 5N708]|uniref:hypothetical protein n=1 Tax=Saccharopolyspora sp. 5N708 TaxID=3457424 RepID=UPI003FD5173D